MLLPPCMLLARHTADRARCAMQSDLMWAMRCLGQSAKIQAASTVLKMQGQGRVAKKLQVLPRQHASCVSRCCHPGPSALPGKACPGAARVWRLAECAPRRAAGLEDLAAAGLPQL